MHICLVAPFADPELGACVLRMNAYQRFLTSHGHTVTVLAPKRPGIESNEKTRRYSHISELFSIIRREKFDLILGTSPPMVHSFVALLAAKLSAKPFVLDLRDPWTYAAQQLKVYKPYDPKFLLYQFIEKVSYHLSDRIFVVTPVIQSHVLSDANVSPEKIALIENGTSVQLFQFDPTLREKIRENLKIPKKAVLAIYSGSFVDWDVDQLIESVSFQLADPDFFLLFLIPFTQKQELEVEKLRKICAEKKISPHVLFVNASKIPFEGLSGYFSAADLGFVTVPHQLDYCIPVKTYDYTACGLTPVAKGPSLGALATLFSENNLPFYTTTWEDFAAQVKTARRHAFDSKKRDFFRQLAIRRFERDLFNARAEQIFLKLVQKKK
ncbi:MAG: glycosyltransferase [Candidatus Diapherotrites archaeon]|uniref:Glycosyltransferase n=1 Tax=Candidatus Iainarchaeum sp. TaxID=3101447 RepID=A0A8T4LDH9_9ARCH|nr:glycosyltransferase [Candidatus Diapherotrites archaeon]